MSKDDKELLHLADLLRERKSLRLQLIHARSESYAELLAEDLKNVNANIKRAEDRIT